MNMADGININLSLEFQVSFNEGYNIASLDA